MILKFLEGTQESYDNMNAKESGTFYLTESNLYLGNIKLNNQDIVGDLRDLTTTDKENLVNVINEVIGIISTKADLNSPKITGIPTVPTATEDTNDTQIANTKFVKTAIANLINGAPTTLDTLKELADAIQENKTIVEALDAAIGNKVDKIEGKGLSANDFTDTYKSKLDGISPGAEVNVQPDWNETSTTNDAYIKNKPDFIISGTQTLTSNEDGGINTYTFTSSNGSTSAFNIKNGSKGNQGEKGAKGDTGVAGVRGSQIYQGTGIGGTSAEATIFTDSGVDNALVNDIYINTSNFNIYQCTVAGNASTAKWVYKGCIKGSKGTRGSTIFILSGPLNYADATTSFQLTDEDVISIEPSTFPQVNDLCISSDTFNIIRCISAVTGTSITIKDSFKQSKWEYVGCLMGNGSDENTSMFLSATFNGAGYIEANATGNYSVAVGANAKSGVYSVTVGANAKSDTSSVAIGQLANASSNSVAIGQYARTGYYANSIAIGSHACSCNSNTVSIGSTSYAGNTNAMAIGYNAHAANYNSIAIGANSYAAGHSIAIGINTLIKATENSDMPSGIAIGTGSRMNGSSGLSIGKDVCNFGDDSIAIAPSSFVGCISITDRSSYSIALGYGTSVNSSNSIAIGTYANISGNYSTAIGFRATTSNANSIQLGDNANLSSITAKVELTVTSDERDKIDIEPIDYGAINFLNKIEPITYHSNQRILYIDDVENLSDEEKENKAKYGICNYNREEHAKGTKKGSRLRVGVSAQGVQKALEEVYGTSSYANLVNDNLFDFDKDEIPEGIESQLAVNYPGFVPFLIKAVQELSQRLDKLEGKA